MTTENRTVRLFLVTLLILTIAGSASAYVDGGTGSMIFQMAVAGFFGALVVLTSFWTKVKLFVLGTIFGRSNKSSDA